MLLLILLTLTLIPGWVGGWNPPPPELMEAVLLRLIRGGFVAMFVFLPDPDLDGELIPLVLVVTTGKGAISSLQLLLLDRAFFSLVV